MLRVLERPFRVDHFAGEVAGAIQLERKGKGRCRARGRSRSRREHAQMTDGQEEYDAFYERHGITSSVKTKVIDRRNSWNISPARFMACRRGSRGARTCEGTTGR